MSEFRYCGGWSIAYSRPVSDAGWIDEAEARRRWSVPDSDLTVVFPDDPVLGFPKYFIEVVCGSSPLYRVVTVHPYRVEERELWYQTVGDLLVFKQGEGRGYPDEPPQYLPARSRDLVWMWDVFIRPDGRAAYKSWRLGESRNVRPEWGVPWRLGERVVPGLVWGEWGSLVEGPEGLRNPDREKVGWFDDPGDMPEEVFLRLGVVGLSVQRRVLSSWMYRTVALPGNVGVAVSYVGRGGGTVFVDAGDESVLMVGSAQSFDQGLGMFLDGQRTDPAALTSGA